MPVTRSQSTQPSRARPSRPARAPQPEPPMNSIPDSESVIVLSSDEEKDTPKRPRRTGRSKAKQKARPATPAITSAAAAAEVVEISSDEESSLKPKASSSTSVAKLRKQLKEKQIEIERLRKEQKIFQQQTMDASADLQEIQKLKASAAQEQRSEQLFAALDDQLNCEICTLKMWSPYTLACGHTFCQTCLSDWFNTSLAQHMALHPTYDPQTAVPQQYRQFLKDSNLDERTRDQIEAQALLFLAQKAQPKYTCPTCRAAVRSRPVEVFALKSLVRTVAARNGETSPKKAAARGNRAAGPWDGFFPFNRT